MFSRSRRALGAQFLSVVFGVLSLAGCGGDDTSPAPDGGADTGVADAASRCASDSECDDGLFCTGLEVCQPGGTGADARGCVTSALPPCMDGRLCNEPRRDCETDCGALTDADSDGSAAVECGGNDCDDGDGTRRPGAAEECDFGGHDEDCNPATFGAQDLDHDGYVDARCCNGTNCGDDCNDGNATIHPTQAEVCNHRDDDCNGAVDDGAQLAGFADMDNDLHGDPATPRLDCAGAAHFSTLGDDCDDADPTRHPAQPEFCDGEDNDCNGVVDDGTHAVTWYRDGDGDGVGSGASGTVVSCTPQPGYSLLGTDCDDARRGVSPGALEVCDGLDDDCNGLADFSVSLGNFEDDDGDGHIDLACPRVGDDCDDFDPSSYPGALELCDWRDNDCDGVPDSGSAMGQWYLDSDGDSYGDSARPATTSCDPQVGRASRGGDCDDSSAAVHPGVADLCNGYDDDCDGELDENSNRVAFYRDADDDGAGTGLPVFACLAPPGVVALPNDCDDANASIGPLSAEVCNGIDDDCDEDIDEGVVGTFYPDADGDGFGVMSTDTRTGCTAPAGYALGTSDCDDARAAVHPGADEVCDALDDDCNGTLDDALAANASCAALHTSDATCTAGVCAIGTCASTYRDCDRAAANGCEVDTATSAGNCSACGNACNPGDSCAASACDHSPVVQLAGAGNSMCARRASGGVACWGAGLNGVLGNGGSADQHTPTAVFGLTDAADISLGLTDACAARRTGEVVCWGLNAYGELGDGTTRQRSLPAPVRGVSDAVQVAVSGHVGCAVRRTGGVVCWGDNARGELGNGTLTPSFVPTPVAGLTNAVDVATVEQSVCAVLATGAVECWGYGANYHLGDGTTADRLAPGPVVPGVTDAVQITGTGTSGGAYPYDGYLVRLAGGGVLGWGTNGDANLGSTTPGAAPTPVAAAGVAGAVDVCVGVYQGCAVSRAGSVVCWGSSPTGGLGRGFLDSHTFAPGPLVPALDDGVAVASGDHFACAARSSTGGVACWGENALGQLGDGTTTPRSTFTPVLNLP